MQPPWGTPCAMAWTLVTLARVSLKTVLIGDMLSMKLANGSRTGISSRMISRIASLWISLNAFLQSTLPTTREGSDSKRLRMRCATVSQPAGAPINCSAPQMARIGSPYAIASACPVYFRYGCSVTMGRQSVTFLMSAVPFPSTNFARAGPSISDPMAIRLHSVITS